MNTSWSFVSTDVPPVFLPIMPSFLLLPWELLVLRLADTFELGFAGGGFPIF
jgi:hypothetical protein